MDCKAKQTPASSGSDIDPRYTNYDERKRKRMISNRESARRSRMRKQKHLDELIGQIGQLENENKLIEQKNNVASQMYLAVATENNVLRAQLAELTDRLHSLNTVLHIAQEVSGLSMDIPEIPETILEPWQLPCPNLSITANADMFEF